MNSFTTRGLVTLSLFIGAGAITIAIHAADAAATTAHAHATTAAQSPPAQTKDLAIVPLEGLVGFSANPDVPEWFNSAILAEALAEAKRAGCPRIVLAINSPGGLVSEMDAICDLIISARDDGIEFVAWPDKAYSAAAIITAACNRCVVRSSTRVGAAVEISIDKDGNVTATEDAEKTAKEGEGRSALAAKFASPGRAARRNLEAISSWPRPVLRAMSEQEAELWWAEGRGFTSEDPGSAPGVRHLDDREQVLTLNAEELVSTGLATARASTVDELVAVLGVTNKSRILDLGPFVQDRVNKLHKQFTEVVSGLTSYFDDLDELHKAATAAQASKNTDRNVLANHVKKRLEMCESRNRKLMKLVNDGPDAIKKRLTRDQERFKEIRGFIGKNMWSRVASEVRTSFNSWTRLAG